MNQVRLREWREGTFSIADDCQRAGLCVNETPATYEQLHLSLLTGLLGNIGYKSDEEAHYLGARGIKFFVARFLAKKAGRWIMAASWLTLRVLWALLGGRSTRMVGESQRAFAQKILWRTALGKRTGQVSGFERATLYGLVVYSQRPYSVRFDAS